jgi:hypothetical protein
MGSFCKRNEKAVGAFQKKGSNPGENLEKQLKSAK